eukprot:g8284.t1
MKSNHTLLQLGGQLSSERLVFKFRGVQTQVRPGLKERLQHRVVRPQAYVQEDLLLPSMTQKTTSEDPTEIGFGFSAGGLLFPYFIGVASCLNDHGILTRDTKMAGSSAGSLISAFYHAGMSPEELMEGCLRVSHDCRLNGTRGRLRFVLEDVVRIMLPDDAHLQCSGKAFIAITRLYPFKNELLSEFESREDLISALLASCHVPVWFDNTLLTNYKNSLCMDGGLTNLIPTPPVPRSIRVSCFPMQGWGEKYKVKISPDRYRESKYNIQELLGMALEPAKEERLFELFDLGKEDASHYIERYTVPSMDKTNPRDILFDEEDVPVEVKTNFWARMRSILI